MGSRLGWNHLVSLTMKNLFKILITILLVNFIFSKNYDFGRNVVFDENMDWFEMNSYNFQIYEYKPKNIYQSVRLEYLQKTPFCIVACSEGDKGLGVSIFYGKYYKSNYLLTSGSIGLGVDYIGDEVILTVPINTEISVIIRDKFGLTLRGVIYPIPENYSFSLGIGIKIENVF